MTLAISVPTIARRSVTSIERELSASVCLASCLLKVFGHGQRLGFEHGAHIACAFIQHGAKVGGMGFKLLVELSTLDGNRVMNAFGSGGRACR